MMKIAIVTHKFCKGDGQGRVNYEIAREALGQGHSVVLIASEVAEELRSHPAASWVSIPVSHIPTALLQNQVFAWQSARWLRSHRLELDLIQVNGAITWGTAGINAVHFVHSTWLRSQVHTSRLHHGPYGLYQWMYTALNARLERQAFSNAEIVVAVSGRVCQELKEIGVPEAHIRIILNGVDLTEFKPGDEQRKALDLPEDVPIALFAGDIRTPRKNLETVLRALVLTPGLHLAVAGSMAGSPYPALSSTLGLSSRVHFLGHRQDMPALMRATDVFVFPSRYEPFGLVLLEALASGLPVITMETVGGADIITPDCGLVLPDPDDAEALAAALKLIMCDASQRNRMSQAARSTAEQYSWGRMAQEYLSIAEQLVSEAMALETA